jgi:hypothetical protein
VLLGDAGEFVELLLFEGAAFGLEFAELLEGVEEAAREAGFVDGEGVEGVGGYGAGFRPS